MTNKVRLEFDVCATGPDLQLQVVLDGNVIWNGYPSAEIETVRHDFDDQTAQEHVLEFYMQGKESTHTVVDQAGIILEDRCVHINRLGFDEIQLGHTFTEVTKYYHDTNGTSDPIAEPFYGVMGCNGRVEMRFSTPIYLWMLENM